MSAAECWIQHDHKPSSSREPELTIPTTDTPSVGMLAGLDVQTDVQGKPFRLRSPIALFPFFTFFTLRRNGPTA
jgi:hypothetical protein